MTQSIFRFIQERQLGLYLNMDFEEKDGTLVAQIQFKNPIKDPNVPIMPPVVVEGTVEDFETTLVSHLEDVWNSVSQDVNITREFVEKTQRILKDTEAAKKLEEEKKAAKKKLDDEWKKVDDLAKKKPSTKEDKDKLLKQIKTSRKVLDKDPNYKIKLDALVREYSTQDLFSMDGVAPEPSTPEEAFDQSQNEEE